MAWSELALRSVGRDARMLSGDRYADRGCPQKNPALGWRKHGVIQLSVWAGGGYLCAIAVWADFFPGAAFGMIGKIAAKPNLWALTDGTLYGFGIDAAQARVLCAALGILLCVSLVRELKNEMLDTFLARQSCWFRWMVIIILFSFIFLFGMYGPDYDESQFIYFQF